MSGARRNLALLAACLAWAAAALVRIDTVPGGLVIDQAEEVLRGLILVSERRVEVLTFVLGNSAETLWLYVLGASATLLGPTILALALPSALAAAATIGLVVLLVGEIDAGIPPWIPFLLAAGSPWLFHYARSGLRAVTAALFVALAALLLSRLARDPRRTGLAASLGAAAGLAVYGYTAARLVPVALAAVFAVLALRPGERRAAWRKAALAAAAGFAVVSIPNALAFAAHPREFLFRGAYSAVGGLGGRLENLLATALLPLHYPDRYRFAFGEAHAIDGVSASLTGSGVDPVPLPVGLLTVFGLVLAWRRRREAAVLFLLLLHGLAVVGLGPLGPSLTRLLLLAPVFAVWASFAVSSLAKTPRARFAAAVVLAAIAAWAARTYFFRLSDPDRAARNELAEVPTAMGERARALARADGARIVVVVAERPNVARYFAWGTDVAVLDFLERPFDAREVAALLPARRILVERFPRYAAFAPAGFAETASPDPRWRELAAIPPSGP